jgi:hypothetical protein
LSRLQLHDIEQIIEAHYEQLSGAWERHFRP